MPKPRPLTPTSLVAFSECSHTTTLDLACDARGDKRPTPFGDFFELIARKGREHEDAYLASLDQSMVTTIPGMHEHDVGEERAAALTLEAMRAGAEIIYQAHLTLPGWRGVADFLEKVPGTTDLGDWGYEPVDTKLARKEALAHHVLQLAFYADAIAAIQGSLPEHVHVELGSGLRETVRTFEVIHYARTQKARLERFVKEPTETIAYPNAHCAICAHRATCEKQWREDDHPSFVAWIRRSHVLDLARHEPPVTTLSALAALPEGATIRGIKEQSFAEIRRQAQLQVATAAEGKTTWEFREREPQCGFDLLPTPSIGDIYLDLEGDPVWRPDRSLVFLFGWIEQDDSDEWVYRTEWAHDERSERDAYDRLVAYIRSRRELHPDMHVFHYSHAETSMLGTIVVSDLEEVEAFEDLVASRVFVDLYKVVRQGLRIGLESYGLKRVERLAGFVRTADVDGGSDAVVLYENWLQVGEDGLLELIASYNEEDCRATRAVHNWLQRNPPTGPIRPRDVYVPSESTLANREAFERREGIAQKLRESFPDDLGARTLGSLLNYYAREDRVQVRELLEMWNLPQAERLDDGRVLTGLTPITGATMPAGQTAYTYPEQEHKFDAGQALDIDAPTWRTVTIKSVDERKRVIVIAADGPVAAIAPKSSFPDDPMVSTLVDLAKSWLGDDEDMLCAKALVCRDLPLIDGLAAQIHVEQPNDRPKAEQDAWLDAICERAIGLTGGPLSIQGPPGTGKTWLAGQVILRLMQAGNSVALTAPSHATIANACKQLVALAEGAGYTFTGERICSTSNKVVFSSCIRELTSSAKFDDAVARGIEFAAGTVWACARKDARETFDYLVIDEAGQFGLANAVAAATCARKGVILVGDPLQLPQVAQARHDENSGCSVLEHILGGDDLIPADRGILLTVTRRMHPDVCQFISDHVYQGRLSGLPELANQDTDLGTGIRSISVQHTGRSTRCPEEAAIIREQALELIGTKWTDSKGECHEVTSNEIMVVAPYNAQVRELRTELATDPRTAGIKVGTVDKFQGGEAPIVFFSMTTSSEDDLPRDKEFLFSRNRLNVAISRAQCLVYIMANQELFNTRVRTVDQMKLISTLCAANE